MLFKVLTFRLCKQNRLSYTTSTIPKGALLSVIFSLSSGVHTHQGYYTLRSQGSPANILPEPSCAKHWLLLSDWVTRWALGSTHTFVRRRPSQPLIRDISELDYPLEGLNVITLSTLCSKWKSDASPPAFWSDKGGWQTYTYQNKDAVWQGFCCAALNLAISWSLSTYWCIVVCLPFCNMIQPRRIPQWCHGRPISQVRSL